MEEPHIPHLRWVLVNGELCEVSEFKDLLPKQRPVAHCPECKREVTLKLGNKKVHHFAHRPEDVCAANNPESALHLNCKFHIYRQLQNAKEVLVLTRCDLCQRPKRVVWKQDWDEVQVEYTLNNQLRPDIALLQNGQIIGAIEVFVTHAVNEDKAQRLQNDRVDWIEIKGEPTIYEEPEGWVARLPLRPVARHPESAPWKCSRCEQAEEKLRKRKEYESAYPTQILFARIVDLYHYSGKPFRQVYYVCRQTDVATGEVIRFWIRDRKFETVVDERAPITEDSRARLNQRFKEFIGGKSQKTAIIDDEMPWAQWDEGNKFAPQDFDNFPFRYEWNSEKKEWERLVYPQFNGVTTAQAARLTGRA